MLNPNSYAVTQVKTNGLCKLILLGTSEPLGTFPWDPYLELWNLHLEPLLGISEPLGTFTQNPNLELWNLPKPYLYLESPSGTLTGNSYLEPCNLFNLYFGTWEPLGTLTWSLGTFGTWNPYWLGLEPLPGTLTWNLVTSWILDLQPLLGTSEPSRTFIYLKPLLGTSEPRGTLRDDCPTMPQGLVWLRPQSCWGTIRGQPTSKQKPRKKWRALPNAFVDGHGLFDCQLLGKKRILDARKKQLILKTLKGKPNDKPEVLGSFLSAVGFL